MLWYGPFAAPEEKRLLWVRMPTIPKSCLGVAGYEFAQAGIPSGGIAFSLVWAGRDIPAVYDLFDEAAAEERLTVRT